MILIIDNYDSFTYNLARYFEQLGIQIRVVRNDDVDVDAVKRLAPEAIVLSPGPCTPDQAGCTLDVVQQLHRQIPLLGVCLGHQAIVMALGGTIAQTEPIHGRTSRIEHDGADLFAGMPSPLMVCRYHSLAVETDALPPELIRTAVGPNDVTMALQHRDYPVVGVQFHPEALLTEGGYRLLANFLQLAGCPTNANVDALQASEYRAPSRPKPLRQYASPVAFFQ